ncbi:putative membrane protein YesL [Microbacterium trichothecenolyticum]|uniref:DUF624 domain-containing protein n=1 Tax=Microbacterium trichothecenolyticum TaxID=69370 RepID=UPI00285910E3|nr:DUF624 domain-containing protein [Microbacterium trichothecenolyticum]MDR7183575.1 putative membrane protein YesL [Microbacterium trichothecenolyticum]
MDRRELRAARRADASGAGPTLEERAPARYPGAKGAFALFGEVLLTGLLVTAAGILVVTLPAALAAGIRHLRRYVNAEQSHVRTFWQDWRRALPGGLIVGVAAVLVTFVLTLDIYLANSGALPGGGLISLVGWAGLVVGAVALLVAAGAWTPERGWRAAVRSIPSSLASDPIAALYLAAAAVLVGVMTWMLAPLIIAGLGCAVFAVVALPARRSRR